MKNPRAVLFLIFFIAFIIFYPSLFNYYTHDDFFLLKISNAQGFSEFFNFFDLTKPPEGLGMYRPLAMQSFFMLAWKLFNLNPLGLHIISFLFFFGISYLVYKLIYEVGQSKKTGLIAAFLYATSSTHFTHLYWLSVFQELAMALFFLISVILFINFLKNKSSSGYFLSIITFLLSLLSKETAIVLPFVLILAYCYLWFNKSKLVKIKQFILYLTPHFILLAAYFYFRFMYYGFPQGDSYVWEVSPRIINTLFWYGLWSFNVPEMLVDFIGPGFKVNLEPLVYWSKYLLSILVACLIFWLVLVFKIKIFFQRPKKNDYSPLFFGVIWFTITLLPILFLPWHKFAYYLTLPLIGVVLIVAYIIANTNTKKRQLVFLLVLWLVSSTVNLNLSIRTSWIVKGAKTSLNVLNYVKQNKNDLVNKNLVFYDIPEDEKHTPWYPSTTLKTVLSDKDFFEIFSPEIKSVVYLREKKIDNDSQTVSLPARQFVEYQY